MRCSIIGCSLSLALIFRLPALQAGVMGDNAQPGRGRESSEAEWISDHAGETGRFPSAHSADPFRGKM